MKIRDVPTYVFFYVSRLICTLISAISPYRKMPHPGSILLIEAGESGWREPAPGLLDIEQSAREYIGNDSVFRVEVPHGTHQYLRVVINRIKAVKPTHFFYDTRTGSQGLVRGLVQSLLLAGYLSWKNIVPLTILTNFPLRKWRRQVSVVTARNGLILVLLDPEIGVRRIPHSRILGPIFMPFSKKRLEDLRHRFSTVQKRTGQPVLTFIGSVYEPRATTLRQVSDALEPVAVDFRIVSRNIDEKKIAEHSYWSALRSSDLIFTTADHVVAAGADTKIPPHMVYRYTEALVAEGCLIAPIVSGPLVPNVHYVPYFSPEQLADDLSALLDNPEKIENIRRAGSELIASRVEGNAWWTEIDHKLAADALKAKLTVE